MTSILEPGQAIAACVENGIGSGQVPEDKMAVFRPNANRTGVHRPYCTALSGHSYAALLTYEGVDFRKSQEDVPCSAMRARRTGSFSNRSERSQPRIHICTPLVLCKYKPALVANQIRHIAPDVGHNAAPTVGIASVRMGHDGEKSALCHAKHSNGRIEQGVARPVPARHLLAIGSENGRAEGNLSEPRLLPTDGAARSFFSAPSQLKILDCTPDNFLRQGVKNAHLSFRMSQEGEQYYHPFQPCPEREQFLKKAASARREYHELKPKLGTLIGTEEYHALNERGRAALRKAEMAVHEYLNHMQKHGCSSR